jgi:MerR family redox-sensitive transcriptional activator SoxR
VGVKKALLPIDEVAIRSGLASSALRYYERCGLLRSGEKIGGRRHYPPSVLQRLSTIKVCQTLGFSLAEIAELLEGHRDGAVWQQLSRIRRAELRSQIEELQSLLEILDTTVDCSCPTLHDCPEMSPEGRLGQAVPDRPRRVDRSPRPVVRHPSGSSAGHPSDPSTGHPSGPSAGRLSGTPTGHPAGASAGIAVGAEAGVAAGRGGSGRERRAQGGGDRPGGRRAR